MSGKTTCPACGGKMLSDLYHLPAIPVQSCILLDTREEAEAFPTGELWLKFCQGCGFVFNAVFDLDRVAYASTTEESQHFSGTFNRFAVDLASEFAGLYDMRGKQTLEIGCGKGDFLAELVRQTGTSGLGIDPGFIPERLSADENLNIRFRREFFNPATIETAPDFIVCRHTLEHIPEVGQFLADIASLLPENSNAGILFETPDVARVLAEGAFWDIYYEHCSYFTLGSHARLFRRAGLNVTRLYLAYEGQYIIQYAEPGSGPLLPQEDDLATLRALADAFPKTVAASRARWADFVGTRHRAGKRLAIWGGGSKGVSFLTTDKLAGMVGQVVDINPFKQGKYLPGTGHRVLAPEELTADPPDTVIVMNPVYLPEIGTQLAALGLKPELVAV